MAAGSAPDHNAEIRLLILEEEAEAGHVVRALLDGGVHFTSKLVETEASLIRELDDFAPGLVLAATTLPAASGHIVLEFTRRTHPEVPVIMMGSKLTAEDVLAFLGAGARDYIFKNDFTRLVPAVRAALRWEQERRARKRTEEQLRISEVRYRRLFESAKDGILILDAATGQIVDANPFMTELLGYSHGEYLGKYLWQIGAFADLVANQAAFEKLRRRHYIRYDNLPLKAKDGRLVDVEFVSNVYPEEGHEHDTIQCNIRDSTQRKSTERKLFQAQKMAAMGIFTGGVAHNINNLLGVIIGNMELLRERTAEDKKSMEYAHEAIEAALQGAELIRRMLAFARQQPLRPQRIDINELVSNIVKTLGGLIGEDVQVSLHLSEEMVWPVLIDGPQLEASIMNLAVNAREAMPHGGRLDFSTSNRRLDAEADLVVPVTTPGDYVAITVSDTGVGMSGEVMQHIFEPFFSTKGLADKPGTGLGMSTVFGFIQQSGGHIGVESKVGAGSTFRLFLPRLDEVAPIEKAPTPRDALGGRESVLVVEDNAAVRRAVVRQLESLGYNVLQAKDAATALAVLAEEPVDLLFTDIVIPGTIDGVALARTAQAHWPSIKILLTTGFGDTASRGDAQGLLVLEKPYRTTDLARALRQTLDGDRASTQQAPPAE
jgi:PAS domain S-box-containing protein